MNLKQYLSFTRKERKGILSLLVMVLAVTFIPRYIFPNRQVIIRVESERVEDMINAGPQNFAKKTYLRDTFASNGKTQTKYLSKRIAMRPKKQIEKIEVNSADTSAFIALPGIGSTLAARIVLFREKLGGFASVGQVAEVYGIRDSVFTMIRAYLLCDTTGIRKININSVDEEGLKSHPYIRWKLAAKITNYRKQHGPFKAINDLKKLYEVDPADLEKLRPYLEFE